MNFCGLLSKIIKYIEIISNKYNKSDDVGEFVAVQWKIIVIISLIYSNDTF